MDSAVRQVSGWLNRSARRGRGASGLRPTPLERRAPTSDRQGNTMHRGARKQQGDTEGRDNETTTQTDRQTAAWALDWCACRVSPTHRRSCQTPSIDALTSCHAPQIFMTALLNYIQSLNGFESKMTALEIFEVCSSRPRPRPQRSAQALLRALDKKQKKCYAYSS